MSAAVRVYTGVWTNWSHGAVHGWTLTLEQQYGTYLANFLAVYVSFAGGAFWRLISFIIHQGRAAKPSKAHGLLHYQIQVLFRNSGTGVVGAATAFASLGLRQRGALSSLLGCLVFAGLAMTTALSFAAASLFTSAVTRVPGNTTIILGPACGGYDLAGTVLSGTLPQITQKTLADTYDAATYVRQCYQQNTTGVSCGTYVQQKLPYTTNDSAICPFVAGMCVPNDKSAFSMDSGYINSHYDLGINAIPEDRILYRKVSTCAPIYASDFGVIANDSTLGETIYVYAGNVGTLTNYTFKYPKASALLQLGYGLSTVFGPADPDNTLSNISWIPHHLLKRTDADVTLFMLAQNQIQYSAPIDDPWMSAHTQWNANISRWSADNLINLLGCAEQIQFCSPDKDGKPRDCLSLTGKLPTIKELVPSTSKFNKPQWETIVRVLKYTDMFSMYYSVYGRSSAALAATEITNDRLSPALPSNQWQLEVSNWFAVGLAKTQASAVEWATAPKNFAATVPGQSRQWNVTTPTDPAALKQCKNQLVRNSNSHMNFSLLGVVLIVSIGGVIIFLGVTIDTIVGWLCPGRTRYKTENWEKEETLKLLAAVYTKSGYRLDDGATLPHLSHTDAHLNGHSETTSDVYSK